MKVSGNLTGREFLKFWSVEPFADEKMRSVKMLVEMLEMADFIDRSLTSFQVV